MFRTLSKGIDVRDIPAGKAVADHDSSTNSEACPFGKLDIRTNAGCNDDHVALESGAVPESEAGHAVVSEHGVRDAIEMDLQSQSFQLSQENFAAWSVKLRVHHIRSQVDDMHVRSPVEQTTGGLEAQETSSYHGNAPCLSRVLANLETVVEGPKEKNTVFQLTVVAPQPADRGH